MEPLVIAVGDGDAGQRLDRALAERFESISRTRLKDVIAKGGVEIDGAAASDPARRLKPGETITITIPEPVAPEPAAEAIPLVVILEDDDLIVIDKPAGLVVHPAGGHETGTLVNALIAHCGASLSGIGGVKRPGIVHRLDKDTSGLMVVAKTDRAHNGLAAQFADHGRSGPLQRAYTAFVWGTPPRQAGTIEAAIQRSSSNREKMAVVQPDRGRFAITHYRVERPFEGRNGVVASQVDCRLETGRTHQIRVHMAHLGHPLLGDRLYGSGFRTKHALLGEDARAALGDLGRQALHARSLGFEHPVTREHLLFESVLPLELRRLADALAL